MDSELRGILEPLRRYGDDLPEGGPPEILPWGWDDRWSIEAAARGTLQLLVDGAEPGEQLYGLADYLLTFSVVSYGARLAGLQMDQDQVQHRYEDAILLNGTALALCGYLSHGQHAEADLWRTTGSARLATVAHNRKAALNDTMMADCLLAVCRIADVLEQPILADLITLRERMWGRLLDHSRAERLHVSESEYPAHLAAPVAMEEIGALMRGRGWQRYASTPDFLAAPADLEEAEGACHNLITLRAHMLVRHQFGSEIDWHLRLFDDKESTVSLGAQPFLRNLAAAYAVTEEEKYALHAARLLWSFYRLNPLPNHHQPLGPWRTLEVGNRQANMWPSIVAILGETDPFDDATHAMLARSRLEHIRYALAFCGGPNNWYQVEAAGLAVAALFSPELKLTDAYLRIALRRLKWINSFAYFDDGFQFELSHGYHVFPTSSMFAVVQAARARGVALPKDFLSLIERAHEMYLFARQPDYLLPTFNDCNPNPTDPAPLLKAASSAFERDDFLWGATHGGEGTAPDQLSHAWPSAGYYVMRDGWGQEDQYLFFDGASWGASHQHEDKLTFVLHANGRLLIGDPNIYSYAWTELTHYFKSSRAHNVVLIDGMGQARRFQPETWLTTRGRKEWVSTGDFDFVSSEYLDGFAPDPFGSRGKEQPIDRRFFHRRAIFYVKSAYWILCDLIGGQDHDQHTLEQIFHLAPLFEPGAAEPLRAGQVSATRERIVTMDAGVGNLAILPVDSEGLDVRAEKGQTNPAVGWYGVLGEFPAWDATLKYRRPTPARLDAVLYPMPAGKQEMPSVQRLLADEHTTALRITGEGFDDTFILCEEGTGAVAVGDIHFEGRALLLRRRPEIQALAVEQRRLKVGGRSF